MPPGELAGGPGRDVARVDVEPLQEGFARPGELLHRVHDDQRRRRCPGVQRRLGRRTCGCRSGCRPGRSARGRGLRGWRIAFRTRSREAIEVRQGEWAEFSWGPFYDNSRRWSTACRPLAFSPGLRPRLLHREGVKDQHGADEPSDQPSHSGGRIDFFATGLSLCSSDCCVALTTARGCRVRSARNWVNSGVRSMRLDHVRNITTRKSRTSPMRNY